MTGILSDKRFLALVGFGVLLATTLLLGKWAFTGSLASNIQTLTAPPHEVVSSDGVTSMVSAPKTGAIVDLIVDALFGICVTVGTYVVGAARWTFGVTQSAASRIADKASAPDPQPATTTAAPVPQLVAHSDTEQRQQDLYDLGRAAANNDSERWEDLKAKFRWPRANDEMAACIHEAYATFAIAKALSPDDPQSQMLREKLVATWSGADAILAELKALTQLPTESKPARGGKK